MPTASGGPRRWCGSVPAREQAGAVRPGTGHTPQRAVLFLHGWSDYFFNVDLARFWAGNGYEFYALDMHNHGRSLRPGTPGGYVANLADYDAEIDQAIAIIRGAAAGHRGSEGRSDPSDLTLMGHSTGGLVAALWVSSHPGQLRTWY